MRPQSGFCKGLACRSAAFLAFLSVLGRQNAPASSLLHPCLLAHPTNQLTVTPASPHTFPRTRLPHLIQSINHPRFPSPDFSSTPMHTHTPIFQILFPLSPHCFSPNACLNPTTDDEHVLNPVHVLDCAVSLSSLSCCPVPCTESRLRLSVTWKIRYRGGQGGASVFQM